MNIIELNHIAKSFSEGQRHRTLYSDLSLQVAAGEFVVLLGRSGSGKSTLLNLISGIDLPDGGEVKVCQQTINALTEHQRTLFRRQNIGFVFQFFNLIPTLTVAENLCLPLELNGQLNDKTRQQALDFLAALELADRQQDFPDNLSGGEQQRVAIVRALVHRPPLLLADEPTGNLDAETAHQAITVIRDLARQQGTTVLMVTHSTEIAQIADRVVQVRDGVIIDHIIDQ